MKTGPSVLALTRQGVPHLAGSAAAKVALGGYVVDDCSGAADLILVATGSEVGSASALVTLISVLCTQRTQSSRSICNVTHYRSAWLWRRPSS
jgi:transketolase